MYVSDIIIYIYISYAKLVATETETEETALISATQRQDETNEV